MKAMGIGVVVWVVVGLLVGGAGCQTSKVGAKNVAGRVVSYVDASPQQVVQAAERVVQEMKLIMVSSASTSLDGQVIARTAQDKRVSIKVNSEGTGVSKVAIRIGTIGDQAVSLRILDGIESHLAGGSD